MGELDVSDILKDATIVYTFDAKSQPAAVNRDG